ncbi:MAG TPA: PAS domain S-box protein, partial [Aquabacterium sp.]|nr:PAS domain S-box protein [Aquabacterium sp.]
MSTARVVQTLATPAAVAMLLLCLLAGAAAVWRYRRQLPNMRALYMAEVQADLALQHVAHAVLVLNDRLQIVQANVAAEELLGGDGQSVVGHPITTLLPGWSLPTSPAKPGAPVQTEAWPRGGGLVPVEATADSFTLLRQQRHVLTLRDLRAAMKEFQHLQRWRELFDKASWGVVLSSAGDVPVLELVNPAYAEMLGYTPEELVGQPIHQTIAASRLDEVTQLRRVAEQGASVRAECRHRHRDGHELPTLISLTGIRNAQGVVTQFLVSVQDITVIKRAEQEATRHATFLSGVLEALPVGVWVGDAQGGVLRTNPAARRFWGEYEPATKEHESLMRRAGILSAPVEGDVIEWARPDRGQRAVLTIASPILDAQGQTVGTLAVDEDLSPVRRSDRAIRQAKELLDRILDDCTVGMALLDEAGCPQHRNLAWNMLMGSRLERDVLGVSLAPEDPLHQQDLIRRVARGALPTYMGEHRLRRASGEYRWTLLVVSRLAEAVGEQAGVLMQVLDVDDQRRSAEEIAAHQLRLAASQRLARIGDWQAEVGSGRVNCSEHMLSMLGYGSLNADGLKVELLWTLVHPDDRARLTAAVNQALSQIGLLDEDIRMRRADGAELVFHVHGLAQRTPEGLRMTGTFQDVTDRKHIESELRESREHLRELVAHESLLIEDERKRIAREVHDELGQLLTALRLDLAMLRSHLPEGSTGA